MSDPINLLEHFINRLSVVDRHTCHPAESLAWDQILDLCGDTELNAERRAKPS